MKRLVSIALFAIAARRMGYRVDTFSPDDDTPTGQVADRNGDVVFPSASTRKISIMMAALAAGSHVREQIAWYARRHGHEDLVGGR